MNIGTVLGWSDHDPDTYFRAAEAAAELLDMLFRGPHHPVKELYRILRALANGCPVSTAQEPDGRVYAPAIVRAYPEGIGHEPHYDRAVASQHLHYAVADVRHQMAVVLVFQNSAGGEGESQPILYDATGGPEWDVALLNRTFRADARRYGVRRRQIVLKPGDLYVFRSSTIHEVPRAKGARARIVLAAFLGISSTFDQFLVWS
jgi:hypothetical protein